MYITISPQKLGGNFSASVADYVTYLEKENTDLQPDHQEHFFNHRDDHVHENEVVKEIDNNAAKLSKNEPRYYSLTINPSSRELEHIKNDPDKLKAYTRQLMKEYASCFNREINGRPVQASDIKYYGKIEYTRTYKISDKEVRENMPFLKEIAKLENNIRKIERGELPGSVKQAQKEIRDLRENAPHRNSGKIIEEGHYKPGNQMHVHLIVSRKDMGNSVSLSPGSKYRASEVIFQGKLVKRGFDRDQFFEKAEQRFDKQFGFKRNFADSYSSRKMLQTSPTLYYRQLLKLPLSERRAAMQILSTVGASIPKIPDARLRLAIRHLQKAIDIAKRSSSLGY